MMPDTDPLIVTATLDDCSTKVFQQLRSRHFPAHRNIVPAHLTLFHHLPGSWLEDAVTTLRASCAEETPMRFATAGLRSLGRGVAFEIDSVRLVGLRRRLAALWSKGLTAQDRQTFKPHVTVQNKVDPAAARALLSSLSEDPAPLVGQVTGLRLWHYRNGPWESTGGFRFGDRPEV